jgi:uncharacterized protein YjbI with pentapeptide repeats
MDSIKIIRTLFTEEELNKYLQKAHKRLQETDIHKKDPYNQGYRFAAEYSLDLAVLYHLFDNTKKAEHYYIRALEYGKHSRFASGIVLHSLYAMEKYEEALNIVLGSSHPGKNWLAFLYEKVGNYENAQKIYTEMALNRKKKYYEKYDFFESYFLQEKSDLWSKAQNVEKARTYNERAIHKWETCDIDMHLHAVEEAWLSEEVGYIYEKGHNLDEAERYYQKARKKYREAYIPENKGYTGCNQADGDWEFYSCYFIGQLFPVYRMISLTVQSPLEKDFRRIRYRILRLNECMESGGNGIVESISDKSEEKYDKESAIGFKRCSYTKKEFDCKKEKYVEVRCPHEVWEGSHDFCIFHDRSLEKDIELFKESLQKKLDKKDYNFRGYVFPEDVDFSHRNFGDVNFRNAIFQKKVKFINATFKNAYFSYATFRGDADFSEAVFEYAYFVRTFFTTVVFNKATFENADFFQALFSCASFVEAQFQMSPIKNAHFFGAKCTEGIDFTGAHFNDANFGHVRFRNADFSETVFEDVSFSGATFKEMVIFAPIHVKELDLSYSKVLQKGEISADLTHTRFHRAFLDNVLFINCKWPENLRIYEDVHMKDFLIPYEELESIYKNLKENMRRHGDFSKADGFYQREMEMKQKAEKND